MKEAIRVFRTTKIEEIISADEVTQDVKDLLVRCPECRAFLTWIPPNSEGSLRKREAHFRHPKEQSQQAKICERRVGNYSVRDWDRLARRLSEERRRIIRQGFWGIIRDHFEAEGFPVSKIIAHWENSSPEFLRELKEICCQYFLYYPKVVTDFAYKETVKSIVDALFKGDIPVVVNPIQQGYHMSPAAIIAKRTIQRIQEQRLGYRLQLAMSQDVVDFLSTPKARPILEDLMVLAINNLIDAIADPEQSVGLFSVQGFKESDCATYQAEGCQLNLKAFTTILSLEKNREIFQIYTVGHILCWLSYIPYANLLDFKGEA